MKYGIYTAPERVERDGRLVCFAGERMTKEEAARRGLLPEKPSSKPAAAPAPAPDKPALSPEQRKRKLVNTKTGKELEAMAESLGIPYPKGATKAVMAEAIVAAEQAGNTEG